MTYFDVPKHDVKVVAPLVREDIKKAFVGCKISLTFPSKSYTDMVITWPDGPSYGQMYKVIAKYISTYQHPAMLTISDKEGASEIVRVSVARNSSPDLVRYATRSICEQYQLPVPAIAIREKDGKAFIPAAVDVDVETADGTKKLSKVVSEFLYTLDARTITPEQWASVKEQAAGEQKATCACCGKIDVPEAMELAGTKAYCRSCVEHDLEQLRAFDLEPPVNNWYLPLILRESDLLPPQEVPADDPNAWMFPVYRRDKLSRIHWLEFPDIPKEDTRTALKAEGWVFKGYRKQWMNNARFADIPASIRYINGGWCNYAEERPDRLDAASERAEQRADGYASYSMHLQESELPSGGQPVVIGTRAGNRYAKVAERAENAMKHALAEDEKSKWLEDKARDSEWHHLKLQNPAVIARRIARLQAEIRSMQRCITLDLNTLPAIKEARSRGDEKEAESLYLRYLKERDRTERMLARMFHELIEAEDDLDAAGGTVAQNLDPQKGDIIQVDCWGACEVTRVNEKTYSVIPYKPMQRSNDLWWRKRTVDKTDLQRIIRREGEPDPAPKVPEQPAVVPAPTPEEKPQRVMPQIQILNIGTNTRAFFPSSEEVAELTCSNKDAGLYPIPQVGKNFMLEPEAGTGAIAGAMRRAFPDAELHCVEIERQFVEYMKEQREDLQAVFFWEDFLAWAKTTNYRYPFIAMNPPFLNLAWLQHFMAAWALLLPGGVLRAILPATVLHRSDKAVQKWWKEIMAEYGTYIELPAGSFLEAGTNCPVILVSCRKPEA